MIANLRSTLFPFLSAALIPVSLLFATPAQANGVTLAAELGPQVVLTNYQPEDADESDKITRVGLGVAARLGYTFEAAIVDFTPEFKLGFQSPGTPRSFSAMGGLRVNFFEGISPALFAHAGGLVGDLSGFVWDIGAGLDFAIVDAFDLGIFALYAQTGKATFSGDRVSYDSNNWQWMQAGVQGAVHF